MHLRLCFGKADAGISHFRALKKPITVSSITAAIKYPPSRTTFLISGYSFNNVCFSASVPNRIFTRIENLVLIFPISISAAYLRLFEIKLFDKFFP